MSSQPGRSHTNTGTTRPAAGTLAVFAPRHPRQPNLLAHLRELPLLPMARGVWILMEMVVIKPKEIAKIIPGRTPTIAAATLPEITIAAVHTARLVLQP